MMTRSQRGFSLIELLVAVAISMVAILAATEMYMATLQTRRIQSMQTPLADEGRFAISMIQRIVSQAGFRPNPTTALTTAHLAVAANAMTVHFEADGTNQITCDGSAATAGATTLTIRRSDNKLQCKVGKGDWLDWIAPATVGSGNGVELVDFAVLAGIDTGPANTPENFGCGISNGGVKPRDCIVDSYVADLEQGQSADQIVAARICLVLRSEATDASVVKPAHAKNCVGADIANSKDDSKLYRTLRTTVVLKNR